MLEFYWSVGRDLVTLHAEECWGAGVVKQFALDMRQAFPDETGFSHSNVKYMKQWYSYYYERVTKGQRLVGQISHQTGGQFEVLKKGQQVVDQIEGLEKSHQVGGELEMPEIFGRIPWKHHVHIISKCQTLDEAQFYHIPQHRYVVIELKVVKYIPEFAGKLNFYVTAVDELLRGEADNPTVGLIICKSTDKTVVEWSLRDINKPLGVSSYQLEEVVERTVKELEMKKGENRK